MKLSNYATNIIENLACRIAARKSGLITANHLMPYLPVTLNIIKTALDEMIDGVAVTADRQDEQSVYRFTNQDGQDARFSAQDEETCLSCNKRTPLEYNGVLCAGCFDTFNKELHESAETSGWPPQALFEHEILYTASKEGNPVHPSAISGHSRHTLRQVQHRLAEMSIDGYINEEIDEQQGAITYSFPGIDYPADLFKRNVEMLEAFPAAIKEEVEIKITKILFILGILILGLFILAFLRVPFIFLIAVFLAAAPIISIIIWRRKIHVVEE